VRAWDIVRKDNVVLMEQPCVGKTHLAISLAIAVDQRDRRADYGTLSTSLEEVQAAGQLACRLSVLKHLLR